MRFFYQTDLNDCGLACLAMLVNHFQKQNISPYLLKRKLSQDEGGVTFFDLLNLAKHFGLQGEAYFCEFSRLLTQDGGPFLINIKGEYDLNHFVLLIRIDARYVYLLDPALKFGRRKISHAEFEKIYLGQILIFKKFKQWRSQFPWKAILSYLRQQWLHLLLFTLTGIFANYLWFLANFFIRDLQLWLFTDHFNIFVLVKFSFYLLGGAISYFLRLHWANCLQQRLWKCLLRAHLQIFQTWNVTQPPSRNFWETINHHHQSLSLLFTVIAKFFSNFMLFPVIVWIIGQTNYWILVAVILCLIINALVNNFSLRFRAAIRDDEDWTKIAYYEQIANYLSNFTNLRHRQYEQVIYQSIQNKQSRYFKIARHSYLWTAIIDLNQQLTQKIFNFVFWFLVFFMIVRGQTPFYDLLILSVTTQLWLNFSIDWLQNLIYFGYNKAYLYNLPKSRNKINKNSAKAPVKKPLDNILELKKFGFEIPGHFYQLPDVVVPSPLQIIGLPIHLDGFYRSCLSSKSSFLIDGKPVKNYKDEVFAIDHRAVPLASTVANNIFLGQTIDQQKLKKINLEYWLKKYNLQLHQLVDFDNFTHSQLQLMNFLSLLFSNYQIYLLNQPLTSINQADAQVLWALLFDLKRGNSLVILGEVVFSERIKLHQLDLDDMI